jgi:hypothetical protein
MALAGQPAGDMLAAFAIDMVIGLVMFSLGAAMFRRRYA